VEWYNARDNQTVASALYYIDASHVSGRRCQPGGRERTHAVIYRPRGNLHKPECQKIFSNLLHDGSSTEKSNISGQKRTTQRYGRREREEERQRHSVQFRLISIREHTIFGPTQNR